MRGARPAQIALRSDLSKRPRAACAIWALATRNLICYGVTLSATRNSGYAIKRQERTSLDPLIPPLQAPLHGALELGLSLHVCWKPIAPAP